MKPSARIGSVVATALASLGLAIGAVAAVGAFTGDDSTSSAVPAADDPATTTAPDATTTSAAHDDTGEAHDDMEGMDHGEGTGHESELDVTYANLPPAMKAQVDITKAVVERYPTAADATLAGWQKATISLNGIGAHYLKGGPTGFLAEYAFDAANPNVLLYDGEGPDAKIAGASFILTEPNPQGYEGDLDVWHYHYGVCFDMSTFLVIAEVDGHEGSTISMTSEECESKGATVFPIEDLYMIHVWVAPDYIEDVPVFAHDHPKLYDGVTAAEQL